MLTKDQIVSVLKNSDVCRFSYTKVDGTVRQAKGTLNPEKLPVMEVVTAPKRKMPVDEHSVVYFDTEVNGWRRFKVDNFIGFN